MIDRRREQLNEQQEEIAFALLMDEYAEAEGTRLLRTFENAQSDGAVAVIPAELDEKCSQKIRQSFSKQARKSRLHRAFVSVRKVAVLLVLFLSLSSVLVLSVEAFRIPVLNMLIAMNERYGVVSLNNNAEVVQFYADDVFTTFEESIPAGYEIRTKEMNGTMPIIVYANAENHQIYLLANSADGAMSVDVENAECEEVDVCGRTALYLENDVRFLMWANESGEVVYSLSADGLTEDEFWLLAGHVVSNS